MIKFKEIRRQVAGEYTRDGVTTPVTRTETAQVPKLPANWQVIALRTATGIVLALTLIGVAWSTYSIGALLGGGIIGYTAAIIFDLGWATALLLEYLARYDERKRRFPTALGAALLLVTMGAIFWHGLLLGSVEMAVIGALVSAFAKALWMGVMKHVNAELSSDDKQWVKHQLSAAQAKAAVAQIKRQVARTEQAAMLEHLAMEHEKNSMAEALGGTQVTAQQVEAEPEHQPLTLTAPTLADMPKSDAIRFILAQAPDAEAVEIVGALTDVGVEVTTQYVRQVVNSRIKPEIEVETDEDEGGQVVALRS